MIIDHDGGPFHILFDMNHTQTLIIHFTIANDNIHYTLNSSKRTLD